MTTAKSDRSGSGRRPARRRKAAAPDSSANAGRASGPPPRRQGSHGAEIKSDRGAIEPSQKAASAGSDAHVAADSAMSLPPKLAAPAFAKATNDSDPDVDIDILATTVVGPVVHRWLLALEQFTDYFDDGQTAFLYCARAGVRIRRLFEQHCAGRGRRLGAQHRMLWSSRLGLCKALYAREPDRTSALIAREYQHHPLRDLVSGLMRNAPQRLAEIDLDTPDLDAHGHQFPGWIDSAFPAATALRAFLQESAAAFEPWFGSLVDTAGRVVLVDSGWQGTAQSLIHRAYPELDVHGLYLGRILTEGHDPEIADRVIGLLFQAETYRPDAPETAIVLHRHLFEALLEPNGPSIEDIPGGPCDGAARAQIAACKADDADGETDALYRAVTRYLADRAQSGPADIVASAQRAMPTLARMLVHPTAGEARALMGKARSADFGKAVVVPVLTAPPGLSPEDEPGRDIGRETADAPAAAQGEDSHHRIARALWPQGQIALEYSGRLRRDWQREASGLSDVSSYFDPAAAGATQTTDAALPAGSDPDAAAPLISIITRTKNRPLLLERAARSVAGQTYARVEWIVVNDGGDADVVRDVIEGSAVDRRNIRLVSNSESLGMEAASNAGIAQARGDYLLIHDDDDTLHPDFLTKTVGFLESAAGRRYGGVVTGTEYVREEIQAYIVIEHAPVPYMDRVANGQVAELLAQNLFAPIAFLYRRAIFDEIGGYNEELPVLGDWFFNLEFLLRADIAVLAEPLAGYHHRDRGDSSKAAHYANSVIGGQSKHLEFAAVMRNAFMRRYGRTDPVAAAAISAYFASDTRTRLDRIEGRLAGTAQTGGSIGSADAGRLDAADATERRLRDEIDRLWALSGILGRLAQSGPTGVQAARALGASAPMAQIRTIIRDAELPLTPHPSFDEEAYLAQHADVASAVERGAFTSGYEHYVLHGRAEGRTRPSRGPAHP